MAETLTQNGMPAGISPLTKALLDGMQEGVVVFNDQGKVLYANQPARAALREHDLRDTSLNLQSQLGKLGGRIQPLYADSGKLGEAVFLPVQPGPTTLAEREKEAIVRTLNAHDWKLAETARELGISRTTLWRRLKAYGLHRDGRSKWAHTS
jgi:transcriptional regulator of acetoin/glycerol metabolism